MDTRYDHLAHEAALQKQWRDTDLYRFDAASSKPVFSFDTPPPTVSGKLHIGHIFSYTHQDIIARFKRMQGFNIFYPMGYDDNGLPTERYVEKTRGLKAHQMPRSEFIALCLQESATVEKLFEELWQKLGLSVDWSRTYSTISDRVRRISQYSFLELHRKKLAYRKAEPSLYCTTCQTSVAQAELDTVELPSAFNTLSFRGPANEDLFIATTRPELLPACVALMHHPDDERYRTLAGKRATVPLFGTSVPIIPDPAVSQEKGTGLVMFCTFGDRQDVTWFNQYKDQYQLSPIEAVGRDGRWTAHSGALKGLTARDARKKILELLADHGHMIDQKAITHHVHVHERCKQEIEYLTLKQWFIAILDHKKEFLAMGDQIHWKPEFMKSRYRDWVENLGWDWCISRQRFFGVPFPVWHCNTCNTEILADVTMLPVDPQETAFPGGGCPQCKLRDIAPDTDVMDTWATSALTPQINANWPDGGDIQLPMSLRSQAHDIIRTWAFDTIVKAYYHHNRIPWKEIVISGHVLAGKEKISKSKENSSMSPEYLLATYPADAIRFWTSHGKLGLDTVFSEQQLKLGSRLITKLWNAFLFTKNHIGSYTPSNKNSTLSTVNQWLLHHLGQTVQQYHDAFDQHDYHHAMEIVERFFWSVFCDNYLELIKEQLNNPAAYDAAIIEGTQYTLYEAGFAILQMYAPVLAHITDAIYQELYKHHEKKPSIHITFFDARRFTQHHEQQAATIIDTIVALVARVRKCKSELQLSLKAPIAQLIIVSADHTTLSRIKAEERLIAGITHAATIAYQQAHDGELQVTKEQEHLVITIPLEVPAS